MELQPQKDVQNIIDKLRPESKPQDHRFTSFDYCYNYFLTTSDLTKDMEKSCLSLGFYLASWGMFRGSSFLLQKSVKHFQPTIEYISTLDKDIWRFGVENYDEKNIDIILKIYANMKTSLIKDNNTDLTLITKVMLGVFGFIPAFDKYFCETFRQIFKEENCGFRKVNKKSLTYIKMFYDTNKPIIDNISSQTFTTNFLTGEKTNINYPKAKIVDMYGFGYSWKS